MKFLKFLLWSNFTSEKGNFEIISEIMSKFYKVNINLLPSFSLAWLRSRNSSFSRQTTFSLHWKLRFLGFIGIFYFFITCVFWIIYDYFVILYDFMFIEIWNLCCLLDDLLFFSWSIYFVECLSHTHIFYDKTSAEFPRTQILVFLRFGESLYPRLAHLYSRTCISALVSLHLYHTISTC